MKRLFFVVLLIAVIVGLYFWKDSSSIEIDPTKFGYDPKSNIYQADPANATFTFDGVEVTLSNGKIETDARETTLLEQKAYGDLNSDSRNDTVVFLAQSGGGSGIFIYVASYVSGPINYKGTNALFLGDRIAPEDISIANGIVTVSYLDRAADEALAAEPTVKVSKQFVYKNGEFQEK